MPVSESGNEYNLIHGRSNTDDSILEAQIDSATNRLRVDAVFAGAVIVTITPPTTITEGSAATAAPGVAVALAGVATPADQVLITAAETNTGNVHIGGAAVTTTTGIELVPTGGAVINIDDVAKVFVVSAAAPQTVYWTMVV